MFRKLEICKLIGLLKMHPNLDKGDEEESWLTFDKVASLDLSKLTLVGYRSVSIESNSIRRGLYAVAHISSCSTLHTCEQFRYQDFPIIAPR